MKPEEIKEGQYLYYTERGCAPFRGSSPDHADSLFYVDWDRGEPRVYCKCQVVDGKYENQEDYLGGRLYESMFTPDRWFLADFPGGDAAEWMSRNYPLDGSGFCCTEIEL